MFCWIRQSLITLASGGMFIANGEAIQLHTRSFGDGWSTQRWRANRKRTFLPVIDQ
jgi:hypothetical protein